MPFFNIIAETNEATVVTEYKPIASNSALYQSEAELEKEFEDESEFYMYLEDLFTVPASLSGIPALSIPYGVGVRPVIVIPITYI